MNRIQTKQILFLDPSLIKASHIKDYQESNRSRGCLFTKYFPKYLRGFDIQLMNASIKTKTKRIKIVKNFRDHPSSLSSRALAYRIFFGNKARFIKSLDSNNSQSSAQLTEKIKLFTSLSSIKLSFGEGPRRYFAPPGFEGDDLIKALTKMKCLRNLKSLEFNQLINGSAKLIHTIDTSPRLLRSLKALAISPGNREYDDKVLEIIKDCPNLLKYVTSLCLPALRSPSHLKAFKSLENSCSNLKILSFEFACRNIFYSSRKADRYSVQCFPVETNYLSAIETFKNLRSLRLYIADTFTFLKDFNPPPLLQSLFLDFEECLTKEILTRIDKAFNNKNEKQLLEFFETNKTITKFCDNFKHLYHLKVLEIFFSEEIAPEDYQHHNYLAQGFIKKIPSLNKLIFVGGSFCWGLNKPNMSPVQDHCLPQFLTSCHSSRQVLQTLEIGHEKVIFSNFNLISSRNKFPSLSKITLTGAIHNNDSSNTEISIFLKQVMTLGTSLKTIKFNTFVHATAKSLLSLLQQLNKLRRPEKIKLELQLKFFDEKLGGSFEEIIKELEGDKPEYAKLQGVSLKIYTDKTRDSEKVKDSLEVYGKKFESFKIYPLGYSFRRFGEN